MLTFHDRKKFLTDEEDVVSLTFKIESVNRNNIYNNYQKEEVLLKKEETYK